jgi:glyoxylase-like metal-dependent hydrolase (beta-lactamase superfamily II)
MPDELAEPLILESFAVGPLGCNCTILGDRATRRGLIIDPGWDADLILDRVKQLGLQIEALIHTHAHIDHINATAGVSAALDAGCSVHADDLFLYDNIAAQASLLTAFGMQVETFQPPKPERLLVDGDVVGADACAMQVIHTPGHTPGSLSFVLEGSQRILFSGDTLFSGGVGRTDLWGGDPRALVRSIRDRLYRLPDDTLVIPGHGEATTIANERATNPFVRS